MLMTDVNQCHIPKSPICLCCSASYIYISMCKCKRNVHAPAFWDNSFRPFTLCTLHCVVDFIGKWMCMCRYSDSVLWLHWCTLSGLWLYNRASIGPESTRWLGAWEVLCRDGRTCSATISAALQQSSPHGGLPVAQTIRTWIKDPGLNLGWGLPARSPCARIRSMPHHGPALYWISR